MEKELLKNYTTMKVGGECSSFFHVTNKDELPRVFATIEKEKLESFVLGGGSNVLFPDGEFAKAVVRMETKGISFESDDDFIYVAVEAGEVWDELVEECVKQGLYGLENLSGIPGSVGASPVQNIGAYGVEVKDAIAFVEVFDKDTKEIQILSNEECRFGYRDSIFKKEEGKKYIVTEVTFKLSKNGKSKLEYKDLKNFFGDRNPTLQEVRDAVLSIRSKKFPDLSVYGTAGSFFKNAIVSNIEADRILSAYPELPVYDAGEGKKKISTAWILDKACGLKGMREGDVGLFENQPLVLVNFGNATGGDVRKFAESIKDQVRQKTGISIEEEVVLA